MQSLFWNFEDCNGLFLKKPNKGLRTYFFENPPEIFRGFFTNGNSRQKKLHPYKLHKIKSHSSEFLRHKSKTLTIFSCLGLTANFQKPLPWSKWSIWVPEWFIIEKWRRKIHFQFALKLKLSRKLFLLNLKIS